MNKAAAQEKETGILAVSSPAFENFEPIPSLYTCDGANYNPPLSIDNWPEETKSFVLIVDDPDAPSKTWVHWLVWDIEPARFIPENSVPGTQGTNDFRRKSYGGPCPPAGTHRYFFKIFALSRMLHLREGASLLELEKAMKPHVISKGALTGIYQRNNV